MDFMGISLLVVSYPYVVNIEKKTSLKGKKEFRAEN